MYVAFERLKSFLGSVYMKELLGTVLIWYCANLAKLELFSRTLFPVWLLVRTGHMRSLPAIWRAEVRWKPSHLNSQCRVAGATQQPLGGGAAAGHWAPPAPTITLSAFLSPGPGARGQGPGCFEGKDLGQVTLIIKCETVRNKQHWLQFVTGVSLLAIVCSQLFFPTTCRADLQQL